MASHQQQSDIQHFNRNYSGNAIITITITEAITHLHDGTVKQLKVMTK